MEFGIVSSPLYANHHVSGVVFEQPERTITIGAELIEKKLMTEENNLEPRFASYWELRLVHTAGMIEEFKKRAEMAVGDQILSHPILGPGQMDVCGESYHVACLAAGGALKAVDVVMAASNTFQRIFCCVRPPGHHATSSASMGYCAFNNVAVAAAYALNRYSEQIKRVLIIDWDIHHGNGTQEIFLDNAKVFYFSTHFFKGDFFPGTGSVKETGKDGTNMNVPISTKRKYREAVFNAFEALAEKMNKYKPDLVIISAGFDAHNDDPMGIGNLTTDDFRELTSKARTIADKWAKGRVISILEGGYGYENGSLPEAAAAHVEAMKD